MNTRRLFRGCILLGLLSGCDDDAKFEARVDGGDDVAANYDGASADATVTTGKNCVSALDRTSCMPIGTWNTTFAQGSGACPFGGTPQTISIVSTNGLLCVLSDVYKEMSFAPGPCSVLLSGSKETKIVSETQSETFALSLAFTGTAASGSLAYEVRGGSNCTRTFVATATSVDAGARD